MFRRGYNKFVRDTFGKKKLVDVKFSDVLQFYLHLVNVEGAGPWNTGQRTLCFASDLRAGSKRRYYKKESNGWSQERDIEKSSKNRGIRKALTMEQQRIFMEYIAGHPIYYHWWTLLTVLLGTGCRIGGDLSKTAIDEFRKKAVKSGRMSEVEVDIDDETLLRNLKLFDGKYLTRAATLLFHPEPELFATGAYIKIGYFAKE